MINKSKYTTRQSKNSVLFLIVLLGVFLFICSLQILTALISAVIMYTLFRSLFLYFVTRKKWSRSLSAIAIIIISFLIIVLPIIGLSVMVINKLILFQQHPEFITGIIDKLHGVVGASFDIQTALNGGINDISKWAIGAFSIFVDGALTVFVALLILYFTLFFMLKSYDTFEATLLNYLPFTDAQSIQFGMALKNITFSNIIGQGLIGLSQGLVVGIGFLIFGIPDPLFWGIVSIFVCFLPVVGAPIIFVPAGIIELASGDQVAGIGIIVWGIILVTVIDNFLRQFVSKKIADTHPLVTIIGVIIGVPYFGIIGLVIGPFLISFFFLLVKTYETGYLKEEVNEEDNKSVD